MKSSLNFKHKTPETAEASGAALLQKAHEKMGMIPNMYGMMANFPPLLAAYVFGYELFRKEGGFTPVEQEVVFLAISYENNCEYCMAAHSFLADKKSQVPPEITEALRNGTEIENQRLQALSALTKSLVITRGVPEAAEINAFLDVGYTPNHVLALLLAVGVKTLSNYSNHLFDTEPDAAFNGREWVR